MIRSLRIATLTVLIWGLGGTSAALARAGEKIVRFHGLALRVPSSWPVYHLADRPSVCVRFNRHAVYLGSPGAEERCPAHQVGRTDAILVQAAARSAAGPGSPLALSEAGNRTAALLTIHGLRVTATWHGSSARVAHALGVRRLPPSGSAAAPTSARAAPTSSPDVPDLGIAVPARVLARSASVVGTGLGFDACAAASSAQMTAWQQSPYRFVGVYLGGANMACSQPNLTAPWVRSETASGWRFTPTYVGLQAPTTSCGCATIQPGQATAEGTAAATDAVSRAQAVGIGRGNPIYFDLEGYTPGGTATTLTRGFLAAWTAALHTAGYLSGVYSSAASGIRDLVAVQGTSYNQPDDIWIANWNGVQTTADPYVPSSAWAAHQRLHQYSGGRNATYGGVTMNIDGNYLDGAVAAYGTGSGSPPLADGVVLQDAVSGALYRVAGGAPLYVSEPAAIGYASGAVAVTPQQLVAMNHVPVDKTFLMTSTGRIFRVAGGAPIAATSWSVFGGTKPFVLIDEWDIDNVTNPAAHLRAAPANGTIVQGLPSKSFWAFSGGGRYRVAAGGRAISVDDAGLKGFPLSCVVPVLRHKTLSQAKLLLSRSHCRLGKVRRPRHVSRGHRPRVVSQSPAAKTVHGAGYKVSLRLA